MAKMSEREKKDYYRNRVERDLAGNPNAPNRKRVKTTAFPPPSKEDEERMKYLDSYGNPIKGYKWQGNKVVPDILIHKGNDELPTKMVNQISQEDYQRIRTLGIHIHKSKLIPSKEGYLISESGEAFKLRKRKTKKRKK